MRGRWLGLAGAAESAPRTQPRMDRGRAPSTTEHPPTPTVGDYVTGYQAVPVNWGLTTDSKRGFFRTLRRVR